MKVGGVFLASLEKVYVTYFSIPDSAKKVLKYGVYDEIEDQNLQGIAPAGY